MTLTDCLREPGAWLLKQAALIWLSATLAACGGGGGGEGGSPAAAPVAAPAPAAAASAATGSGASIGSFPLAERDRALSDGLRIWRQQRIDINGVNKGACASCHSSDGIELALWAFNDTDVVRRAHIDGVSVDEQLLLVKYFAALRQRDGVTRLRDVASDRPFQPTGQWYTGSLNQRDLQFGEQTLAAALPTLMGAPVQTLAQAQAVLAELRASNPLRLKIGIELPHISFDCARGAAECSMNDWMSDLPRFPRPERETEWFALNDRYIANPTDAALRELLVAVDTMTTPWLNPGELTTGPAGNLGTLKFKSMQVLQHLLRRQQRGLFRPEDDLNPMVAVNGPGAERANFPFVVGDIVFNKFGPVLNRASQLPVFVRKSLGETAAQPLTDADVEAQKAAMAMPWWWAGFMFDPGLSTGTSGEYFVGTLGNAELSGYAFHQLYAGMRSAVEAEYRAQRGWDFSVTRLPAGRVDIGGVADSAMLFVSAEARMRYRQASVNWVRTQLLVLQDQLRRFGSAALSGPDGQSDGFVCQSNPYDGLPGSTLAAAAMDGQSAAFLFQTYNEVRRLAGCPSRLLPESYQAGTGSGLRVEWFGSFNPGSRSASRPLGETVEPILSLNRQEFDRGYFRTQLAARGGDAFSGSRSSGFLVVPVTGDYVFGDRSDQQARLWVDGQMVYDSERRVSGAAGYRVNTGATVRLVAGQTVPILFERYNAAYSGISLGWALADGALPMHEVPTSQLSPR
jgi:hypothetical protein